MPFESDGFDAQLTSAKARTQKLLDRLTRPNPGLRKAALVMAIRMDVQSAALVVMYESFAPIHNGALGFELGTTMSGALKRNGFFQALTGVEPADKNHAFLESQHENLKSLCSSFAGISCASIPKAQRLRMGVRK